MPEYIMLKCKNCAAQIGHENGVSIIYGGCLIEQPKTNLYCSYCKKYRNYGLSTDKKAISFLTDAEITELTKTCELAEIA